MYISECNRLKLNLSFSCYQRIDSDSQICDISISKLIENIVIQYCKAAERVEKLKDSTENKYNLISKEAEFLLKYYSVYFDSYSIEASSFPFYYLYY